jgi:hypothetical protein
VGKEVSILKILIFHTVLLATLLLTACTAVSEISVKSDRLESQFDRVTREIHSLQNEDSISKEEQKNFAEELGLLRASIDDFKAKQPPPFLKNAKRIAVEKLDAGAVVLNEMQKKFRGGTAAESDLDALEQHLPDDINFKLFSK